VTGTTFSRLEQICRTVPCGHASSQIAIVAASKRYTPRIDVTVARAFDLAVLEHSSNEIWFLRQMPDFLKERSCHRWPIRHLPSRPMQRARDRALLVARRVDVRARDGMACTVTRMNASCDPMRRLVDGSRDQLLAGSPVSPEYNTWNRWRRPCRPGETRAQGRR